MALKESFKNFFEIFVELISIIGHIFANGSENRNRFGRHHFCWNFSKGIDL